MRKTNEAPQKELQKDIHVCPIDHLHPSSLFLERQRQLQPHYQPSCQVLQVLHSKRRRR